MFLLKMFLNKLPYFFKQGTYMYKYLYCYCHAQIYIYKTDLQLFIDIYFIIIQNKLQISLQ